MAVQYHTSKGRPRIRGVRYGGDNNNTILPELSGLHYKSAAEAVTGRRFGKKFDLSRKGETGR